MAGSNVRIEVFFLYSISKEKVSLHGNAVCLAPEMVVELFHRRCWDFRRMLCFAGSLIFNFDVAFFSRLLICFDFYMINSV